MLNARLTVVMVPALLALALGCGGAPAPDPATEATTGGASEGAKTSPPDPASTTSASDKSAEKPTEPTPAAQNTEPSPSASAPEPAPAAKPAAEISCDPKPGAPAVKGKLEISIDRSKVDIDGRRLEVKLSRPACKIHLKVIGESGSILSDFAQPFDGAPAGSALVVTWPAGGTEPIARVEVWGHDTSGFYVGMAITPWNVKIPHEEVNFENDSDVIRASEVPKLEASLQKIKEALNKNKELGNIALFIAGHTDSVGSAEYNLGLSRRRARSIAGWFRGHGLGNPISYEGLGESSLLVKTPDETAEARNRRVDYILSIEQPRLPSGSASLSWKGL